MGECIISRSSIQDEAITIVPGYHSILLTLKDDTGMVVRGHPVFCADGNINYNYKTNENGKVIFTCNSGSANIFINNYTENGMQILDLNSIGWINVDAPVGLSSKLNIKFNHGNEIYDFDKNTILYFYRSRLCDIYIVGAGGGGGGGRGVIANGTNRCAGSGGGSGYMNNYYNQILEGKYTFISGVGGKGGNSQNRLSIVHGSAGGTSYIENTNYSAIGGNGGGSTVDSGYGDIYYGGIGIGGLGNGGWAGSRQKGEDSPVNFAGGGGAGDSTTGGNPYGGYTGNPTGGPGGGGAGMYATSGGNGGNGMLHINIKYN